MRTRNSNSVSHCNISRDKIAHRLANQSLRWFKKKSTSLHGKTQNYSPLNFKGTKWMNLSCTNSLSLCSGAENDFIFWSSCRGTAQLKSRGIPTSSDHLRREVEPFIKYIRFFTMTSDEFVQNVLVADLLSSDESVITLKHIARPGGPILTSELLEDGIKLCPSREPRTQLITKVQQVGFLDRHSKTDYNLIM